MIHIEPHPDFLDIELLKTAARAALDQQSAPDDDITIALTDDTHLRQLNCNYLGIDAPTDVLSFSASELDPETGARYLGDIIISVDRAAQQARDAGHSLQAEMQLLVVHGALHLLGHDHAEAEQRAHMWAAQVEILRRLGLPHIRIFDE